MWVWVVLVPLPSPISEMVSAMGRRRFLRRYSLRSYSSISGASVRGLPRRVPPVNSNADMMAEKAAPIPRICGMRPAILGGRERKKLVAADRLLVVGA